jgi:hypothetical protein
MTVIRASEMAYKKSFFMFILPCHFIAAQGSVLKFGAG